MQEFVSSTAWVPPPPPPVKLRKEFTGVASDGGRFSRDGARDVIAKDRACESIWTYPQSPKPLHSFDVPIMCDFS